MNPVLLLHGALGSQAQLDLLKARLESRGQRVYSLNFSGHCGKTFHPDFGIETFSNDILSFMDRNKLPCVNIFGYSMGCYVALYAH